MFQRLARAGTVLALFVVLIGAWVRLTDAGLGCPDWPGCYGQLFLTDNAAEQARLAAAFPDRPLDVDKAWREMLHRYLATILGFICLLLVIVAWLNRGDPKQPKRMPFLLLGVVIFQGLLGMWTVTLLLKPIIVMGHLLGGMTTLGLLSWLSRWRRRPVNAIATSATLGLVALIVLVLQIALGGWTSANYAALACPDFPTSQPRWWPPLMDFQEGFVMWRGLGIDYEGGVLDNPARVAIHFTHRLGAILAVLVIGVLGFRLLQQLSTKLDGMLILVALATQLILGASIVLFGVPLAVAVGHNGVAALLLLTVLNANQRINQS